VEGGGGHISVEKGAHHENKNTLMKEKNVTYMYKTKKGH
jgi:hypothetical protein